MQTPEPRHHVMIECGYCKRSYKGIGGLKIHLHSCRNAPEGLNIKDAAEKMIGLDSDWVVCTDSDSACDVDKIIVNHNNAVSPSGTSQSSNTIYLTDQHEQYSYTCPYTSPEKKKKSWVIGVTDAIRGIFAKLPCKTKKIDQTDASTSPRKPGDATQTGGLGCVHNPTKNNRRAVRHDTRPNTVKIISDKEIHDKVCISNKEIHDKVCTSNKEIHDKAAAYKKTPIPKALRVQVWNVYIGKEIGVQMCPLCNSVEIQQGDGGTWHASHVIAEAKGGKTCIDNLRVCCRSCNTSMGTCEMIEYCKKYYPDSIVRLKIDHFDTGTKSG